MKPLQELDARNIRGLFFDIDDTLTTDGQLTAEAYAALARWHNSGRLAIPITGRPAGWCDHIARMWPVDAVVGENGAFWFAYDRSKRRLSKRFLQDDATRQAHRLQLQRIEKEILLAVPGCAVASDQRYREADLAIDFCEDVPALSMQAVQRIAAHMRAAGMNAKISSIHVNGWFGDYDKLSMTRILMREHFAIDLDSLRAHYAFIGDSPNDAPMFAWFVHSVGVANVQEFATLIETKPRYITPGRSGLGFVELVDHLLAHTG